MEKNAFQTIHTIPERCRVCYTCVRECPAKAIRILDGQAKVIHDRCIGCGNCVRVCSQHAKQVVDSIPRLKDLLTGDRQVAAIVAPSFPADFDEPEKYPAVLRALGFRWVSEVAFGADLVARKYRDLLENGSGPWIATSCPAVVMYVEKYEPDLVDKLAPIVSPMVATARVMRAVHGKDVRVVFVGPCTAKKSEGMDEDLSGEIDCVITFKELKEFLADSGIDTRRIQAEEFDPPLAGLGALFPLCGGMIQAADMREDLVTQEVVTANGLEFTSALREFAEGKLRTDLLEMLACRAGCIIGAGIENDGTAFHRRGRVSTFVREHIARRSPRVWKEEMGRFKDLNLSRTYRRRCQIQENPDEKEIRRILQSMGKNDQADELNCGACGYRTCREHAVAIFKGLAEDEMCLPYTIDRLNQTVKELAHSQEALMQSERLASMGQLAAGIAHEVNNPLGVVLMYAHLVLDAVENNTRLKGDVQLIAEQADRCRTIVSGLLHFARQNKVMREETDIAALVGRSIRAVVNENNVRIVRECDTADTRADVDADQLQQVLTNLISNAYAAMPDGGTLTFTISGDDQTMQIRVRDTGTGIREDTIKQIFEPFFTTKQMGKGTGLGLAVVYGIMKMHNGNITVESNADPDTGPTGTTFTVTFPRKEVEK